MKTKSWVILYAVHQIALLVYFTPCLCKAPLTFTSAVMLVVHVDCQHYYVAVVFDLFQLNMIFILQQMVHSTWMKTLYKSQVSSLISNRHFILNIGLQKYINCCYMIFISQQMVHSTWTRVLHMSQGSHLVIENVIGLHKTYLKKKTTITMLQERSWCLLLICITVDVIFILQ